MVSACNDFVSNHGEDLETMLFKGVTDDLTMRKKLCIETKICQQLWTPEQEEQKVSRAGRHRNDRAGVPVRMSYRNAHSVRSTGC